MYKPFILTNPLEVMVFRGDDPTGHGYYGAKRGNRKHKGVDIIAKPKVEVFCPIDGFITKIGQVYSSRITDKFKYIEVTGSTYRVRLMYVGTDLQKDDRVFRCDPIGKTQDISSFWGGNMINHLHIEVYKHGLLTDPEPLFKI